MPRHVVVDGSNLATEAGRCRLQQLNDAVNAFIAENPTDLVTVVWTPRSAHRIDPKEVPDFEEAIEHNELVAPPAGAVGRGDAFVLSIANKVGAVILSNDSFQEFNTRTTRGSSTRGVSSGASPSRTSAGSSWRAHPCADR